MKIARSLRVAALLGAVAVAAGACGGAGSSKAAPVAKATSTTQDPAQAKVLADFNSFADVYARALADPNVTTAEVAGHMTGQALNNLQDVRVQLVTSGRVIKSEAVHHPTGIAISGTTATVQDCVTNNQTHYYAIGGGPHLSDIGDATASDEVTLQLENGTWKVANVVRKGTSCPG